MHQEQIRIASAASVQGTAVETVGDSLRDPTNYTLALSNAPGAVSGLGNDTEYASRPGAANGEGDGPMSSESGAIPIGPGGGGEHRPLSDSDPVIEYTLEVVDNHFVQAPGNADLQHNIPDLEATFLDGRAILADFLSHFLRTGGITRWGYPTSEVLMLKDGTLTQFYQRGAVDFHDVGSSWLVERRLAWEFVGGGVNGSENQGTEPGISNPHAGTLVGPWGHKVSDTAIDGTDIGFAEFFYRFGGTEAFGFPKTDARQDTGAPGTLQIPGLTLGFIRQYFQAAIFEFHPEDPGGQG